MASRQVSGRPDTVPALKITLLGWQVSSGICHSVVTSWDLQHAGSEVQAANIGFLAAVEATPRLERIPWVFRDI